VLKIEESLDLSDVTPGFYSKICSARNSQNGRQPQSNFRNFSDFACNGMQILYAVATITGKSRKCFAKALVEQIVEL